MTDLTSCPCGSGLAYQFCCNLLHSGVAIAPTASSLMRSRFSAYALDNMEYVKMTWDASTRPSDDQIHFAEEQLAWQRLEILDSKKGGVNDNKGVVEFKAFYSKNGEDQHLHEVSRFIKTNSRWYYVDGVVRSVGPIVQQKNEGKNAPCACGSGKKFKRCCGAAR